MSTSKDIRAQEIDCRSSIGFVVDDAVSAVLATRILSLVSSATGRSRDTAGDWLTAA